MAATPAGGVEALMAECRAATSTWCWSIKSTVEPRICDFAELTKFFDQYNVSFCSVTRTSTPRPRPRMMLNILMTFAQYEREIIGERIREFAASKRKGMWMGGMVPLGYCVRTEAGGG